MPLKSVQRILQAAIGLDVASIGEPALRRAVNARIRGLSLAALDPYVRYLEGSPAELQQLVEAVVVPETWFFREPRAFAAMVEDARGWFGAHPNGVFRLLSLPCSTGEEPYSMAMALLDGGLPSSRFAIDAIDISQRAIEEGIRGLYGKNSFRGANLAFRARHFTATPEGHQISNAVRARVAFVRSNILDEDFMPGTARYDMVFCRNMLIYFDEPARHVAVGVLKRLLRDDGTIFVGPSEAGLMLDHGLASAGVPFAFAFRKAPATKPVPAAKLPVKAIQVNPPTIHHGRRRKVDPHIVPPVGPQPAPPGADLELSLEHIGHLADRGLLEEAGRACEAYLREREPTADALLLLGLIRDAAGDAAEAVKFYRRALYLEPNHPQALAHLALLLEKEGDAKGAKVMSERLRRQGKA